MNSTGAGAGESFPTTFWPGVRGASADRAALARLIETYRGPLVEFLCRKGAAVADAEDAVHQFIADRILGGQAFLARADETRGRFRAYLRTTLWYYWLDRRRAAASGREAPNRAGGLVGDETAPGDEAGEAFDTALALRLFGLAVRRFGEACRGRPDHWGVFEGRVLALISGGRPVAHADLAARWGFGSEKQAANAFQTVQNKFRRCWAEVLAEHLGADSAGDGAELVAVLGRAGPALLDSLRTHLWEELPDVTRLDTPQFPPELGELMNPAPTPSRDPGDTLRHVLTAPVWLDTGDAPPALAARLRHAAECDGLVLKSFLDLFQHPNPSVELLTIAKDYAKANRTDPDSPLPREVATVLYYAAIAAALVRRGERITENDDAALRAGFGWVAAQPWVGDELQELASAALERVRG